VSPDGRWRWDGTQWVLNAHRDQPIPRQQVLVPSMDTKPLQTAVVVYLVIAGIVGAYITSTTLSTTLHNISAYQAESAAAQSAVDQLVNLTLGIGVAAGIAWNLVLVIGTLRRWRWVYYVVMIFGFVAAFGVLADLVTLALNSHSDTAPAAFLGVMSGLAYLGIAIWMFRLWRERGTAWGMQRVTLPAGAPGN
jgi:hypothetical protein